MIDPPSERLRAAVLLSGGGRTLANLLDRHREGRLLADIVCVASNKARVRGLEIAHEAGIDHRSFLLSEHEGRRDRDAAMWSWVHSHRPDIVLLAGYLALLDLSGAEGLPVLNIHPALLPAYGGAGYYGNRVHAAVLEAGEAVSGCTVHLVDEEFDRGRILAQRTVDVLPGDDVARLAQRVFRAECELYPQVLNGIARGEIDVGLRSSAE